MILLQYLLLHSDGCSTSTLSESTSEVLGDCPRERVVSRSSVIGDPIGYDCQGNSVPEEFCGPGTEWNEEEYLYCYYPYIKLLP